MRAEQGSPHVLDRATVNAAFQGQVMEAWEAVQGHNMVERIKEKNPPSVTTGGTQTPLNQQDLHAILEVAPNDKQVTYVCGGNLAWINFSRPATPFIPVRMRAVKELANTIFAKPRPIESVTIALPSRDYKPLEHRGGLHRLSPDEITAAYIFAIKRDIDNQKSEEVLMQWREHMLCTTFRFVLLPTHASEYWFALDQREQMDHQYRVCHRSWFQRLHEVVPMVMHTKQAMGTSVTARLVEQEYKKNLPTMVNGPVKVTSNFIKSCLTIDEHMLTSPSIHQCLRDMDDRAAYHEGTDGCNFWNPFDALGRLQAIIDMCKNQNRHALVWVVEGIWFWAHKGLLSIDDLNRGFLDLLLFKRSLRFHMFMKSMSVLGPESRAWLDGPVAQHTDGWGAWLKQEEAHDMSWRSRGTPAENVFIEFFTQAIFGRSHDNALNLAINQGKSPAEAINAMGISMLWQECSGGGTGRVRFKLNGGGPL